MNPDFLGNSFEPSQIAAVFDLLPETYFFCKDKDGRFVYANDSIVKALGLNEKEQLLGKTDFDFFDPELARQYLNEDHLVMSTGQPIQNQLWLVPHQDGTLHWYLSSKTPLFSPSGEPIGIAGVMRDYEKAGVAGGPYRRLAPVLEYVQNHFRESIAVAQLADLIHVSVSTLERHFQNVFSLSPSAYLLRVRLHAAKQALQETSASINEIALDTGFYDQSHFTKKFRMAFSETPSQYRKRSRRTT